MRTQECSNHDIALAVGQVVVDQGEVEFLVDVGVGIGKARSDGHLRFAQESLSHRPREPLVVLDEQNPHPYSMRDGEH